MHKFLEKYIFKFKIKKTHLFYIQNVIFSVSGKNDFL